MIARPPLEQWEAASRAEAKLTAPELLNLDLIARLRQDRTFQYAGVTWKVHVPFEEGVELSRLRAEFDELVEADELPYNVKSERLRAVYEASLSLIAASVTPKNPLTRIFLRLAKWSPWNRMTNADWVAVTRFLLMCRMRSGVQYPLLQEEDRGSTLRSRLRNSR